MKANDLIQSALDSLGYSHNSGNTELTQRARQRCSTLFEMQYAELLRLLGKPVTPLDWDKPLDIPTITAPILIYGFAAVIAKSEDDLDNYNFFIAQYDSARRVLNHFEEVSDVIPMPE